MTEKNYLTFKKLLLTNPLMATVKLSRYKFASKMLNKNDDIIDVGCGGGISTFYFSQFCKSATGIDNDIKRIKEWDELKSNKVRFLKKNARDLKTMNSSANCIINLDFIEHLNKKEGIRFIEDCKLFLKKQKNGKNKMLIIGTPSFYSKKYRAKHNLKHHKHEYKPDELNEICQKYFSRTLKFTMNDELVHTGFDKLGWYFFLICFL